jgi:hypothetical protein
VTSECKYNDNTYHVILETVMAQTEPDYLVEAKGHLPDQLDYHSKQSRFNKKGFYSLQIVIIITSALVPIVNVIIPGGELLDLQYSRITR